MNFEFNVYFQEEHKFGETSFRLYHDWIYDKIFGDREIDPELSKLIKIALFKASWNTLWAPESQKVVYEKTVLHRARIPSGELRGKVISKLPPERSYIPILIQWTKSNNEIVAKAASHKINSIQLHISIKDNE